MADQHVRMAIRLPQWVSAPRIAFLACLIAALLYLQQALDLDMWTVVGPGPGLFPAIATSFCCVLAALLLLFPRLGDDTATAATREEVEEEDPAMLASERRVFWIYCLILPLLVAGSAWLGFLLLSIGLAMTLTWWAEGRSWRGALMFGLACGLVGNIAFSHFLGTSVPQTEVDQTLLRLIR